MPPLGALIDPSEPAKILPHLKGLVCKYILSTHHHWDHTAANEYFSKRGFDVLGGDPRIPFITRVLKDKEGLSLGSTQLTCIHTPCHTTGHLCYLAEHLSKRCVFTGDTLFIGGCGKFFEGNALDMYNSLKKLKALHDDTVIYPGHEYARKNYQASYI